jgi:transposase
MIAAYRHPEPARGRQLMPAVIDTLSAGVPAALTELRRLGRTLKRRSADVLAYIPARFHRHQLEDLDRACAVPVG